MAARYAHSSTCSSCLPLPDFGSSLQSPNCNFINTSNPEMARSHQIGNERKRGRSKAERVWQPLLFHGSHSIATSVAAHRAGISKLVCHFGILETCRGWCQGAGCTGTILNHFNFPLHFCTSLASQQGYGASGSQQEEEPVACLRASAQHHRKEAGSRGMPPYWSMVTL